MIIAVSFILVACYGVFRFCVAMRRRDLQMPLVERDAWRGPQGRYLINERRRD